MTLELSDTELDQLRETANRLGVSAEDLLRLGIEYLLSQSDKALADLLQTQQTLTRDDPAKTEGAEEVADAQADRRRRTLAAMSLQVTPAKPDRNAWERQSGIFADDPIMADIFEAGRKWREANRGESSE